MALHTGPRDGDYAKYIDQLMRQSPSGASTGMDLAAHDADKMRSAPAVQASPASYSSLVEQIGRAESKTGHAARQAVPASAANRHSMHGTEATASATQNRAKSKPSAIAPAAQRTRRALAAAHGNAGAQAASTLPESRKLIGTVLRLAGYAMFLLAFRNASQLLNLGSSSLTDWAPVAVLLIAGKMLLSGARAARNPRVAPTHPEERFPQHIEH